jgi:hypothetical protein
MCGFGSCLRRFGSEDWRWRQRLSACCDNFNQSTYFTDIITFPLSISTTMSVTRNGDFLPCAHFRPDRTDTGDTPQFGDCCGAGHRNTDTLKKSGVAAPSCCIMRMSSSGSANLVRAPFLIRNYSQPEANISSAPFWYHAVKLHQSLLLY